MPAVFEYTTQKEYKTARVVFSEQAVDQQLFDCNNTLGVWTMIQKSIIRLLCLA